MQADKIRSYTGSCKCSIKLYNHLICFKAEQAHRNEITFKRDLQMTLVVDTSKVFKKRYKNDLYLLSFKNTSK